jgi:hypothetical protein
LPKNLRNSDFFCTFADGNEKQVSQEIEKEFLKKLKTSFHFQISRRDLTISDVAHAQ